MTKTKGPSIPPPTTLIPPKGIGPIEDPNPNDVLSGRGGRINAHAGNVQFREIVQRVKPRYLSKSTKKLEKAHIAHEIVAEIRGMDPSGRFLKEDPETGLWWDIGDEKARKKAGQALREDAPDFRHEKEGNDVCAGARVAAARVGDVPAKLKATAAGVAKSPPPSSGQSGDGSSRGSSRSPKSMGPQTPGRTPPSTVAVDTEQQQPRGVGSPASQPSPPQMMNAVGSPAVGTTTIRASPIVTPSRQGIPQPTVVHRSASWVSGRGLGGASRNPQHYPGRGGGGSPASNGGYGGASPRSADGYNSGGGGGLAAPSPPRYGPGGYPQDQAQQQPHSCGGGVQGQLPQHLMPNEAATGPYMKPQTPSPRYGPGEAYGQQQYQEQQYQDAYNYPPENPYAGQQGYAIPQGYAAQAAQDATQAMPPPSPVAHHQQHQESPAEQEQYSEQQQSTAYRGWGEMRDNASAAFQKPFQAAKAAAKRISPSAMMGSGGGGAGGSVSSSGNRNVAFGRHFQPVPPRSRTGTGERSEMSLSGFSSVGGSGGGTSLDMSILAASAGGGTMAGASGKASQGGQTQGSSASRGQTTPWAMMKRREFVDGQLLPPNKVKHSVSEGWGRGAAHAAAAAAAGSNFGVGSTHLKVSDKSSSTSRGGGPPSVFAGSDISELSMTLSIGKSTQGSSVKSPHGGSLRRTLSMPGMRQSDLMSLGDASFDALLEEAALSGVGGAGPHQPQPVIRVPGAEAPAYLRGSKLSLGSSSSSGDKKSPGGGASSKASSANSGGGGSATRMSPLSEASAGGHRVKQENIPQGQGSEPLMMSGTSATAMGAPFHPVSSALLQSSVTGGPAMGSLPPQQRAQRIRTQTDGSIGGRSSGGRSSGGRSSRSRESGSWVETYQSMASVGSDMYAWNEEESRASSEISADLMALDLADGGSLCLLPPLGPGQGGEGHASEDTMEVANT